VEDALSATRAAVEEGILPGGGVGLLNALPALDKIKMTGDELTGVDIIRKPLKNPSAGSPTMQAKMFRHR